MKRLWSFLRKRSNREILGWVGGGIVVVIAGIWTAFVYFSSQGSDSVEKTVLESSNGSIAAGRDAVGNTINRRD